MLLPVFDHPGTAPRPGLRVGRSSVAGVSTRAYIILAALTGLAILLAFAIQIILGSR